MRMTEPTALALQVMLSRTNERYHGLRLAQESGVAVGSIYPLMSRLENEGWVSGEWELREAGHPRKLYGLTGKGLQEAPAALARWECRAGVPGRMRTS